MGEVIELPYRYVPAHLIKKLIRGGYLPSSRRHEIATVIRAWEKFRHDANRRIGGRNDPPNLA